MKTKAATHQFSHAEVASLIRSMKESGDKVFSLLAGILAMLPLDEHGKPKDPVIDTLLAMAMEEVADISFQTYYREKLQPGLIP